MREISAARLAAVASRVHAIALAYRDTPVTLEQGALVVEAVRIPHSGWPTRQRDSENLAFRVTLDATTTVTHLGMRTRARRTSRAPELRGHELFTTPGEVRDVR